MTNQLKTIVDPLSIPGQDDIRYDEVPCPEWGGEVRIGSLTAEDITSWLEAGDDPKKKQAQGLRLMVKSLVNSENGRVPEENQEALVEALKKKNAGVVNRIIKGVRKLNGLDAAEQEAAKNASGGTDSVGSPSA
jgi:hypothetical protein